MPSTTHCPWACGQPTGFLQVSFLSCMALVLDLRREKGGGATSPESAIITTTCLVLAQR